MKVGLQICSFTWPGGAEAIGPTLARIVQDADEIGFDSIWVMDHFFQIRSVGRPEEPMLEGLTTLGFMAAHSTRARLGLMVGGVHYRQPALWVKATTALDVLSGGRAWLGIGAAWNEEESRGLGFPFPPLGERFELLEETLQYAHAMWEGDRGSGGTFEGRHTQATRLLNSPQAISRPRPPIMIGGGGERKTLRFVARYAQACNLFPGPDLARKLDVLREHCEAEGRDYDDIRKTCYFIFDPGEKGEKCQEIVDQLGRLAEMGFETAIGAVANVWDVTPLEIIGSEVIPAVASL